MEKVHLFDTQLWQNMLAERAEKQKKSEQDPSCVGVEKLMTSVSDIDSWAGQEGIAVKYVSGLMATRINSETQRREVLLVKGSSKGKPKEFWQFPGGHVLAGEGPVVALHRELREEMSVEIPNTVSYVKTYIPKPKPDTKEVLAIHAFMMENCDWKEDTVTLGDDVSEMIWTDNPLVDENGNPRILTEQVDYMLRKTLGYEGPKNKNTCPDEDYMGRPDIEKFLKYYFETYNPS